MHLHGLYFEDLSIGQSASFAKTISEADIVLFTAVSGDTNPVHINQEYAEQTQFKGRVAHGMLTASLISTVLGTRLPGPGTIYMGQNLRFTAPVPMGATVTATVTVCKLEPAKRRVTLACRCSIGALTVVIGEAIVRVPSRPA